MIRVIHFKENHHNYEIKNIEEYTFLVLNHFMHVKQLLLD